MTSKKPTGEKPSAPPQTPSSDVALIHGPTPDGKGLQILRARGNQVEIGAIRPLVEGAPITGEVVTLRPRPSFPALCDVEVQYKAPAAASDTRQAPPLLPHHGPAQVASDDYRNNWDLIWSQPASKQKRLN